MKVAITIDIGSGVTKSAISDRLDNFPSLIGPAVSESGFRLKQDDMLEFNGKIYYAGDSANSRIKPDSMYSTLTNSWAGSDGWFGLLYYAISRLFQHGNLGDISLCTGVPVAYYAQNKATLPKKLSGTHTFKVSGKVYEFRLKPEDIVLVPQALGLYFSHRISPSFKKVKQEKCCYIDIGTYTTGWVTIEENEIRDWGTDGTEFGVGHFKQILTKRLTTDFNLSGLSPIEIDRVVREKHLKIRRRTLNLEPLCDEVMHEIKSKILGPLGESLKDNASMSFYVGGGGSMIFMPVIKEFNPAAELLCAKDDAMFSVVKGLHAYHSQSNEKRKHRSAVQAQAAIA